MTNIQESCSYYKVTLCATAMLWLLCLLGPAHRLEAAPPVSFKLEPNKSCLDCHAALVQQPVIHAATEGGKGCTSLCHQQTDPAMHLFSAQPKPISSLCFRCHDKEREDQKKIKLPPTKRLFEDTQAQLHPPFATGDCGDCHLPHASTHNRLLNAAYPAGFYQTYSEAAYALCLNCHAAAAFKQPRTIDATAFRNGNLNLHQRHVNKDKGRSCRACHNPHGSRQAHLIKASFRFGTRDLGINFEASANGGSCITSCHVKVTYDRLLPVNNPLRTSPRQGTDATPEELKKNLPAKK